MNFEKKKFFQIFFSKLIFFHFLEFLADFCASTLKISEICSTFRKKLIQIDSLSVSHQKTRKSHFGLFFFIPKENATKKSILNQEIFEIFEKKAMHRPTLWPPQRI